MSKNSIIQKLKEFSSTLIENSFFEISLTEMFMLPYLEISGNITSSAENVPILKPVA